MTYAGAYRFILSFILGFGGLLALVYGAAVAGSEWTWGALKSALARGEGRARYVALTFVAVAIVVGVGLLGAFALGVVSAAIGATIAGMATNGIGDAGTIGNLPSDLAREWLGLVQDAALGYATATVARSQLAGIGAGIAIYSGAQFGALFLPDLVHYLPFSAASAALGPDIAGAGPGGASTVALDSTSALLWVTAWLIAAVAVAAIFTERADVGG